MYVLFLRKKIFLSFCLLYNFVSPLMSPRHEKKLLFAPEQWLLQCHKPFEIVMESRNATVFVTYNMLHVMT